MISPAPLAGLHPALSELCRAVAEELPAPPGPPIRALELFAGVGGFRLALERASPRFSVVYANQWEPATRAQHAADVYRARFGDRELSNVDIATLDPATLPTADLWCAGFPCQDYSVATALHRAGGIEGRKGVLWWQIHRLLSGAAARPRWLLFENVDRLLKSPATQRGRDMALIIASLADLGYCVAWRVVNAADYGMPQRRTRIYLLAHPPGDPAADALAKALPTAVEAGASRRLDLQGDLPHLSEHFNADHPTTTPFLDAGCSTSRQVTTWHATPDYRSPRLTLGDVLQPEEQVPPDFFIDPADLPRWQRLKAAKSLTRTAANGHQYRYSEGSMAFPDDPAKPSRTIITAEGGAGPSRFKHVVRCPSGRLRRLTPVELERLDMMPDGHTLGPPPSRRAFLLGNALVTGVVERIARQLASCH